MSDQLNVENTIGFKLNGKNEIESGLKSIAGHVKELQSAIVSLLGTTDALGQSLANVANVDFKKINKGMKSARTAEDQFLSRTAAQAGSMNRAGIKTASNHTELQEHIKAMADLANSNAKLIEVMKHLTPEEIGLKKSGHKIATANTQLGWAKLENQQDRFFKYSNNFMGGLASNLQMMNSRIMNSGGLMGFMGRLGYRMSNNKNGFWSSAEYKGIDKKTGKPIYGELPKNNINKLLGLDEVTGGKGINFGPMAMMAPVAAVAGVAALGKAIYNLGEEAKVATGQIQAIKTQMSIVMGSGTIAENIYSGVEKFALKSPFGVETSADMAALLKQSGVNATDLLKTLRMIGDTSSGNAEKMKRVANNYAQIQAIGKASMLDMRQFAYAGIPIYKEVAEYMKVSQQELRKMISEGKVTANIIEAVFERMTGKGGVFENATMRGAQTIAARTQNLMDAQMIMKSQIGQEWMDLRFGSHEYGQGLGNFLLNLKENLATDIASISSQRNTERAGNDAISLLTKIEGYTNSIDGKMPANANGEDFYTNKKIIEFLLNQAGGQEKVWGDLAKLAKSDIIKVADTDYETGEVTRTTKGGYSLGKDIWTKQEETAAKNALKTDWTYILKETFLKSAQSPFARYFQDLVDSHQTLEEFQKNYRQMMEDSKRNDRADYLYQGYARGEVAIAARAIMDSVDSGRKKGVNSEVTKSMQDLAAQFNTEYKNSYAGKVNEEMKKRNEWKVYSQTYDKFAKYQDENNKLLLDNIKTLSELRTVLDSGIFSINMMDIAKMSQKDITTASKNFAKAMDFASMQYSENQLKKGNYRDTTFSKTEDYKLFSAIQLALANNRNPIKEVSDFLNLANNFSDQEKKDLLAAIFGDITGDKKAKKYVPPELWARLGGGVLGLDPNRMKTPETLNGVKYNMNPAEVLKFWTEGFAKRDMVRTLMPSLMDAAANRSYNSKTGRWEQKGFSVREVGNAFVTDSNGIVNWKATADNMSTMARSASASISNLETMSKAIQSQTSKITEFYTTLTTGGETLSEKLLNADLTEELKTAFNTGALKDKQGHKLDYINGKLSYVDDQGKRIELTEQEINALGENAQFMAKLTDTTQNLIETNNSLKDSIDGQIEINKYNENYNQTPEMAAALSTAMQITSPLTDKTQFSVRKIKDSMWNKTDWDSISGQDIYTNRKQFLESTISELNRKILSNSLSKDDERIIKLLEKSGLERKDKEEQLFDGEGNLETWINKNVFDINDIDSSDNFGSNSKLGKLSEDVLGIKNSAQEGAVAFTKLGDAIKNAFSQAPLDAFNNSMSKLGENIVKGVNGYEDMDKVIKNVGKSMMSNLAAAATQAGLSLISSGKISAGLALIAAGGMASFLGGLMSDTKDESDDGKLQKLKDLKQDLADLLRQAREDAIYYENHLRHSNALSYNSAVSNATKVNDAIITPQGNVITTHPEDYLIASKNPSGLAGGAAPVVNIDIQNNSGKQISMRQEKRPNNSGGFDVLAVIEEAVGEYVSSSRSDDAFAAREARIRGRSVSA